MFDRTQLQSLTQLAPPVLTAYLDTNPASPRNQGSPPGYLTALKSPGQAIANKLAGTERAQFRQQLRRVTSYLQDTRQRQRGVILFAGPASWQVLPLQVDLEDELHWGRPSLKQLLWLLDEYRPTGAVVVTQAAARFLRFSLGEVDIQAQETFSVDVSKWRKKHLVGPSHPRVGKSKGADRDLFESRLQAQYSRFYHDLAKHIRRWAEQQNLARIAFAGKPDVLDAILKRLPPELQEHTILLKHDLWQLPLPELQSRLQDAIDDWERKRELALVNDMLSRRSPLFAVGTKHVLDRIQKGRVRLLVIAKGWDAAARQCEKCGQVSCSNAEECPLCAGRLRPEQLRAIIPDLVQRFGVKVEVVAGRAARKLLGHGGIAARA